MGGGVPRGLGLCFTLLAWGSATGIAHSKRPFRDGTILGLLCALAALSHPVAMYWSILGAAAIAMESSSAESTKILLFSLFITVITILPWLGWCTWNHGLVPFVSAAQTRSSQFDLLQLFMRLSFLTRFLGPLPWVSVLALIGTLYLLAIGRPALFLLTILFCVFDISGFETFGSGIIASVGAAGALAGISDGLYKSAAAHSRYAKASLAALGILFLFSSAAGTLREISASPSPLTSPSRTQVASLRTFFLQFPPSAKFVVIADSKISGDALPEWFMTITGRRVINLHQGMEWRGEFSENYKLLKDLQGLCRGREVSGQLHERFTALAADYAVIDRRSCKYLDYRWRARRSDALAAEDPDFSVFMFDRVKDELPDEEQ